jgi:hypothetical protein
MERKAAHFLPDVPEFRGLRYQALESRATFSGGTSVTARLVVCGLFSRQ